MTANETAKTSKPLQTSAPKSGQLHRLGFVPQYGGLATEYAAYFYSTFKGYVPETLRPRLNSVEQLYNKHGQPVVNKLADGGQEILLVADGQIDGVINNSVSFLQTSTKELQNLTHRDHITRRFASTREVVVKKFQDIIDFAQKEGLAGSLHFVRVKAASTAEETLNLAKKVLGAAHQKSQQAYGFAQEKSHQVYGLAQNKGQQVYDIAQEKGQKAHDTLVKQPLYKKAYDSSNNLLGAAQDTVVYKQTVKRLYPVVAPIADPALEKIQPYYKNTVEYWKPLSTAA